ncbi:hypothetical protein CK503_03985 [Aliifodinibius salipaludis]|uniref:Uncharacterized protein n=1 Tax=Fodinibius salipaludis TaxID=2032627 RepID=A0A2A2GEP5_9BACT|nr:hypothetical protein [Aliifodinibius salipaludis]PAU95363.1 hypothetical protein CK503_03985 [Aliifodinibius salipaludis]
MKTEKLLLELEELVEQLGYTIRKEKGTFQGDSCVMEGQKLVVLNKKKPEQQQVGLLARVLKDKDQELADIYIKPVIRKQLQELWDRFDKYKDSEIEEMDIDI